MIVTRDVSVEALLRGGRVEQISEADLAGIRDALQILDAASRLEDTLYAGRRTIRVITGRRRRYYVDTGSRFWIAFQWRVHDAINVEIVRLGVTSLGSAFRR
jgi:plasmid maintenance system killer protein